MTKIFLTAFCAQENNELLYFFKKETEIIQEKEVEVKIYAWGNLVQFVGVKHYDKSIPSSIN